MTLEQLRIFREYPCEEYQRRYRYIFFLIFYLIVINIDDLLELKHENLINGRIEYHRKKTNKLYSIKVEPEAMEIIDQYRGKNYLLNIMDECVDYHNFTHRMNLALKQIGEVQFVEKEIKGKKRKVKKYKPFFSDISTYWTRYTWATIAASLDIRKAYLRLWGMRLAAILLLFISSLTKKIDEANRKVIDHVFEIVGNNLNTSQG